jgi:hypothetical protein
MGHLVDAVVHWVGLLNAVAISPQISPPASFPSLSPLERRLVRYALEELDGFFRIRTLHEAFRDEISRHRLSGLAQAWEASALLTQRPRRVTYALQVLATEQAN